MPDDFSNNILTTGMIAVNGTVTDEIEALFDEDWFQVTLMFGHYDEIEMRGTDTGGGTLPDPAFGGLRYSDGGTAINRVNNDAEARSIPLATDQTSIGSLPPGTAVPVPVGLAQDNGSVVVVVEGTVIGDVVIASRPAVVTALSGAGLLSVLAGADDERIAAVCNPGPPLNPAKPRLSAWSVHWTTRPMVTQPACGVRRIAKRHRRPFPAHRNQS